MTLEQLRASLAAVTPPGGETPLIEAMWWAAKGDWERAHHIAQEIDTRPAALVHAYLHRAEGDAGNAGYWYRQADRQVCRTSLDEEWEQIAQELLAGQAG